MLLITPSTEYPDLVEKAKQLEGKVQQTRIDGKTALLMERGSPQEVEVLVFVEAYGQVLALDLHYPINAAEVGQRAAQRIFFSVRILHAPALSGQ